MTTDPNRSPNAVVLKVFRIAQILLEYKKQQLVPPPSPQKHKKKK